MAEEGGSGQRDEAISIGELATDAFLLSPSSSQTGTLTSGLSQIWTTDGSTEIVHIKNKAGTAEFALYTKAFDYTTINALSTPASLVGSVLSWSGTAFVADKVTAQVAWSSLQNPAASTTTSLTMGAGSETTFTIQSTTQTGFTWTTSTLTSGVIAAFTSTGTVLAAGNSMVKVTSSGANGTSSITATGATISVTNTGTTSTNVALTLTSSGASTNTALNITAGQILSGAAQTWALPANTASSLVITDGTNAWVTINTQTGAAGVQVFTVGPGSSPTIASAANATFFNMNLGAYTVTLTGSTTVTTMNGMSLFINAATITDSSAVTVTNASTLYIAGPPIASGSVTITNANALTFGAASKIASKSNVAASLVITDGTNAYYTLNNQTGTDNVVAHTLAVGTAVTVAGAAGSTYSLSKLNAFTWTTSTTTTITAMNGLMMNIAQPTIAQSGGAVTVTTASSLYLTGAPIAGASVTVTNAYAIQVATGESTFGGFISSNSSLSSTVASQTTKSLTATAQIYWNGTANAGWILNGVSSTTLLTLANAGTGIYTIGNTGNVVVTNTTNIFSTSWKATGGAATEWLDTGNASAIAMALNVSTTQIAPATGYRLSVQGIAGVANNATGWALSDQANNYYVLNTQTATDNVAAHTWSVGTAVTVAGVAGSTFSLGSLSAFTWTTSTTTTITAMNGLTLSIGQPTIAQSGGAVTVTSASTLSLGGLAKAGASVTITSPYGINIIGQTSDTKGAYYTITAPAATVSATLYAYKADLRQYTAGGAGNSSIGFYFASPGNTTAFSDPNNDVALYINTAAANSYGIWWQNGIRQALISWVATSGSSMSFNDGTTGVLVLNKNTNTLSVGNTGYYLSVANICVNNATANVFQIFDASGTSAIWYQLSTTTSSGTTGHNYKAGSAPSFASAAGNTYSLLATTAYTLTLTGTTTVTALNGLMWNIASPTVTDVSVETVTTASSVIMNGPLPAGSITFTNSFALDLPTFATNGITAANIRCAAPTGATNNFGILVNSGASGFNGAVGIGFATVPAGSGVNVGAASTNNSIWNTSQGGATTVLYIGNAAIATVSDSRLKSNITTWTGSAMEVLRQAHIVSFTWNDPSDRAPVNRNSRGAWIGMLAQETIELMPWIVSAESRKCSTCLSGANCQNHRSIWTTEYQYAVPFLIKGMQEMDSEVQLLKREQEKLRERLDYVEQRLRQTGS